MKRQSHSAFLSRMSRLDLTVAEREALEDLDGQPEERRGRALVFDAERPDDRIAIMRSGWSAVRVQTDPGRTTITHIYAAGDVIGFNDLGVGSPPYKTTMQTDGSVILFSRTKLFALASTHPRLFDTLLSLASIDTAVLLDRMHAIARLPAEDRLQHFFLSLKARVDHCSLQASDRFPLPFSQQEIGDALGLTAIYVNRIVRRLEKSGELTRAHPYIRLNNRNAWEDQLKFRNRYAEFDLHLLKPVVSGRDFS